MTKGKGKNRKVAVQGDEETEKKKISPPAYKLAISKGLDGFDSELEQLVQLYEQLQLITTELADPEVDMLTFAYTAHYFGVLHVEKDVNAEENAAHQEMTEDIEDETPPLMEEPEQPTYPEVKPLSIASKKEKTQVPVETSKPIDTAPTEVKQEEETRDQMPGPPEWPPYLNDPTIDEDYYAQNRSGWDSAPAPSSSYSYNNYNNSLSFDPPCRDIAGFVYLTSSQQQNDYLQVGQLRIGLILTEKHRNKGYGRQAVQEALKIAFQDPQCTRVQAILIDGPCKDRALGLFMKSGMGHEGVRLRGFRSPYDFEFKDVTYLGLLATDYVVRSYSSFLGGGPSHTYTGAPKSLWDELFARHQREREELLKWEERQERQLKRTSSTETIRQVTASADSDAYVSASPSEAGSVKGEDIDMEDRVPSSGASDRSWTSGSSRWVPTAAKLTSPTKRRRLSKDEGEVKSTLKPSQLLGMSTASSSKGWRDEDANMDVQTTASIVEWRAQTETTPVEVPFSVPGLQSSQVSVRNLGAHRPASSAFSDDSDVEGDVSDGYATSASSSWDVVETGSTSGSSSIVDIDFDDALDIYDDSDDSGPHAL